MQENINIIILAVCLFINISVCLIAWLISKSSYNHGYKAGYANGFKECKDYRSNKKEIDSKKANSIDDILNIELEKDFKKLINK